MGLVNVNQEALDKSMLVWLYAPPIMQKLLDAQYHCFFASQDRGVNSMFNCPLSIIELEDLCVPGGWGAQHMLGEKWRVKYPAEENLV